VTNLGQRVVSGVILAAVVLGLTWLGGLPFRVLAALIGALVFHEWATMSGLYAARRQAAALWLLVAIPLLAMVAGQPALPVLAASLGASLLAGLVVAGRAPARVAIGGVAYALFPAVALALLRGGDTAGLAAIVYLFAVVWATDILAYFTGRALGGPKLAPSISPGKTWSGAAGGAAAGVAAGTAAGAAAGASPLLTVAGLALFLSVVSQAGDLFESALKRRWGAKDSSALIPGHGGVMDRVDGLVAAAVALYLAGWVLSGADSPAAAFFAG
jgi:phosphatidate cytidylyltransferase